jgi:hypothetical protein
MISVLRCRRTLEYRSQIAGGLVQRDGCPIVIRVVRHPGKRCRIGPATGANRTIQRPRAVQR